MSRIELLKRKFETQDDSKAGSSSIDENTTENVEIQPNGTVPSNFRPIDTSSVRRPPEGERVGNNTSGGMAAVSGWRSALKPTPGSKTLFGDGKQQEGIKVPTQQTHTKLGYLGNKPKDEGCTSSKVALKPPSSLAKVERRKIPSEEKAKEQENNSMNLIRRSNTTALTTIPVNKVSNEDKIPQKKSQTLHKKALLPPSEKCSHIKLGLNVDNNNSVALKGVQNKHFPLKSRGKYAISKDSRDDSHCLIDDGPAKSSGKAFAVEKWRKHSEGKGIVTRARKESGAPLTNSTKDSGRGGGGGGGGGGGEVESNGHSAEEMDEEDDEEEEEVDSYEDEDGNGDSSEDTISIHSEDLDDVFWDERSEFGFLDDDDDGDVEAEEQDGDQLEEHDKGQSLGHREYHSESELLHHSKAYIRESHHQQHLTHHNHHHHHHHQHNHHHFHSSHSDHNHPRQRRPTSPSVIPLRQNKLLKGKCYKEYRLSRSLPNLADEGHLVLSISNAQGLFQKAQQKVRGGRRISSRRFRHSRRNKPPVPRKPTNLAQKLNNNKQSFTSVSRAPKPTLTTTTTTTTTSGPKVQSKPPLTAAKSTGASLEPRRVNNLSQDQRTYDQVCFEDPATFSPAPKSKNLEHFFGMKPEMAQPIKCIKPIDPLRASSSAPGSKSIMKIFPKRKSQSSEDSDEQHYLVVNLHEPDRTAAKGSLDRRGGKNSASSLSPNKPDLRRNSSGQDNSSDSGISMMISTERNSRGHLMPDRLKVPVDQTDSDFVEGDSTYSDDSARGSDSSSEEEFELKERPAENITFINQSHKVAYEVLTSERQYVDRLHLLHKVFEERINQENNKHNWFPKDVTNVIFSNLKTIYQFHDDFLLKQLEDRMKEWEKNQRLGDILVRLSPFLKLYTDYVGNFDKAVKCLNTWKMKVPNFASLLQEIQKKPVCVNLTLQHHMLEPVQRIPRYELLLKEYLKKLPAESSDRANAESALDLISKAAHHSNDMMQNMDHSAKLVKLNEKIDFNGDTIIDPSRRLLKEGKITRVAARSGDLLDRYLFLFNDILLCCIQKRQITGSITYKVKDKIDIDGVKLLDGNSTRFRLERSPKSLEFETNTDEQKEEWMAVLLDAIKEMVRKKDSFKTSTTGSEKEDDYAIPLGERAPSFVKDDDTTMCMKCGQEFNLMRRRHHCRACGAVVCSKCSNYTAPLPYDDKKPNRVCSKCYHLLKGEEDPVEPSRKSFVDIDENKSYASYLWYYQPKQSVWVRYWVAATEQDLFALRAPKDVRAALTLPIKLYQAFEVEQKDHCDREYAFKLCEGDNSFIFAADKKETKYNWLLVFHEGLQKVLRPSSSDRNSSTNL